MQADTRAFHELAETVSRHPGPDLVALDVLSLDGRTYTVGWHAEDCLPLRLALLALAQRLPALTLDA